MNLSMHEDHITKFNLKIYAIIYVIVGENIIATTKKTK